MSVQNPVEVQQAADKAKANLAAAGGAWKWMSGWLQGASDYAVYAGKAKTAVAAYRQAVVQVQASLKSGSAAWEQAASGLKIIDAQAKIISGEEQAIQADLTSIKGLSPQVQGNRYTKMQGAAASVSDWAKLSQVQDGAAAIKAAQTQVALSDTWLQEIREYEKSSRTLYWKISDYINSGFVGSSGTYPGVKDAYAAAYDAANVAGAQVVAPLPVPQGNPLVGLLATIQGARAGQTLPELGTFVGKAIDRCEAVLLASASLNETQLAFLALVAYGGYNQRPVSAGNADLLFANGGSVGAYGILVPPGGFLRTQLDTAVAEMNAGKQHLLQTVITKGIPGITLKTPEPTSPRVIPGLTLTHSETKQGKQSANPFHDIPLPSQEEERAAAKTAKQDALALQVEQEQARAKAEQARIAAEQAQLAYDKKAEQDALALQAAKDQAEHDKSAAAQAALEAAQAQAAKSAADAKKLEEQEAIAQQLRDQIESERKAAEADRMEKEKASALAAQEAEQAKQDLLDAVAAAGQEGATVKDKLAVQEAEAANLKAQLAAQLAKNAEQASLLAAQQVENKAKAAAEPEKAKTSNKTWLFVALAAAVVVVIATNRK